MLDAKTRSAPHVVKRFTRTACLDATVASIARFMTTWASIYRIVTAMVAIRAAFPVVTRVRPNGAPDDIRRSARGKTTNADQQS